MSDSRAVFGAVIQLHNHFAQLGIGDLPKIRSLGEVLPYQAIRVLVGPTLPGAVGITEVRRRRHRLGHGFVAGEYRAIVQSDGLDSSPTRLQQADYGRLCQFCRDLGQPCRQQIAAATLDQRDQARLLVPLDHGVALPVADETPVIELSRAVLDPYPVGDLAQPSALGLDAVLAATFGLTEMPPVITTPCLVIPDQGVDPLMTDAYPGQWRYEAADLLWAPLLTQPADNGGNQARQTFCPLPGCAAPMITEGLGLFGIIAI